jgi:hypothetical protein
MSNCHVAKTALRERAHLSAMLAFQTRSTKMVSSCKLAGGGEVRLGTSFVKKNKSCCAGDDRTETHYVSSSSLWRSYPSSLVTSLVFQHSPAQLSFCLSDQLASWLLVGIRDPTHTVLSTPVSSLYSAPLFAVWQKLTPIANKGVCHDVGLP